MKSRKLNRELKKFSNKKEEKLITISGELGLPLGGQKLVEVPGRNGFVYVRLKNNTSEVIQAYNSEVSTIYGLAVLVARQNNIYKVIGRDQDKYRDWGSIPYLPKHGGQHSFNQALGMGADITWVYTQQVMPLLGYPSGTNGSDGIVIAPYTIRDLNGNWKYVGNTGTPNITMYSPSSATGAVMVLVYVDTVSGNPYLLVGSGSHFSATLTGTNEVAQYIPKVTNPNWLPDVAVRLTSGTTQLTWANLYDVRPFLQVFPTGTGGGSSVLNVQDEGIPLGTISTLNVVGVNADISISGTVGRLFITGSAGIPEAPINTGTYGRKNASWVTVAPIDPDLLSYISDGSLIRWRADDQWFQAFNPTYGDVTTIGAVSTGSFASFYDTTGDTISDSGYSPSSFPYTFYAHGLLSSVPASTTYFTGPFFMQALGATEFTLPTLRAGTIKNFYVRQVGNQPATGTLVCTVRKSSVDTALVITIAAGAAGPNTRSNISDSVSFAAGDFLSFKFTNNATSASATIGFIAVELLF